jgi:signal transduction histidine kinase
VLVGSLFAVLNDGAKPAHHAALGWVLTVLGCAAVFFRRKYPLSVAGLTLVCCALYYPLTDPDGLVLLAFAYTLYNAAAAGRIRGAALLVVAAMAGVAVGEISSRSGRHVDNFAFFLMTGWFVALVAGGAVAHYRAEAERTKEAEARTRATDERLRIARELHDVLGHHLALITVHAGAAADVLDDHPAEAKKSLAHIRQAGRTALAELKDVVVLLRRPEDPATPTEPAGGLAALDELVASFTRSGLRVEKDVAGVVRPLPAAVDVTAYRVIQESLTNVAKHAGDTIATIRLRYDPDQLSVVVDDQGAGGSPVPGHGIAGMRERVTAVGGTLRAGPGPTGGFRVSARVPLGAPR